MSLAEPSLAFPAMLGRTFVAEVCGPTIDDSLAAEALDALRALVHRYGVLVMRGQELLSDQALAEFAGLWGPLFTPAGSGFGSAASSPIIRIGNLDLQGRIRPPDDDYRKANDPNVFWHIDNTFSEPPAKYSMLLARIAPQSGGETEFADAALAWEELDPAEQERLRPLRAVHSYLHSRSLTGYTKFTDAQRAALPDRDRPLVFTHPDTGRQALCITSHIRIVDGHDEAGTKELLDRLVRHATQPRYVYRHHWMPGDLLIYDNRLVLHRAVPFTDDEQPRDLSALRVM